MAKKRILFIGNACVTFSAQTPYIPAPGEQIISRGNYGISPAGHGFLSAAASGRLGGDPALCACVGQDYFGDRLKETCRRENIHAVNVEALDNEQTGMQLHLTEKDGTLRRIWLPGAAKCLDEETVLSAFSCYPDAVVVSSSLAPEVLITAAEAAEKKRLPFILDEDPDGPMLDFLPLEKLCGAELLLVNETRFEQNELRLSREDRQKQLCYALYKRAHVKAIVMRLGSKGCFLYDGKYFSLVSSSDVDVIDTEGSGAVFTAAFVGEYLSTEDLLKASQAANTATAYSVSRKGGFSSLPKLRSEEAGQA